MKRLTERTEIAKAINYNEYPVLTMDLANKTEYGYTGCKVKIEDGTKEYTRAELMIYSDEKKFTFHSGAICLSDSFGYSDCVEMLEYANAPIVKPDEDILIMIINSETGTAYAPYIVHTGKQVSKFCITPLTIESVNLECLF